VALVEADGRSGPRFAAGPEPLAPWRDRGGGAGWWTVRPAGGLCCREGNGPLRSSVAGAAGLCVESGLSHCRRCWSGQWRHGRRGRWLHRAGRERARCISPQGWQVIGLKGPCSGAPVEPEAGSPLDRVTPISGGTCSGSERSCRLAVRCSGPVAVARYRTAPAAWRPSALTLKQGSAVKAGDCLALAG